MPEHAFRHLVRRLAGQVVCPAERSAPALVRGRPWLTLVLIAGLSFLYLFTPGPESLAYSAAALAGGEYWRLLSGHLVHADPGHLFWNLAALAILGGLIERHSRALLLAALAAGALFVNLLLLSPWSALAQYCGLSGVLNSLLVVALFLEWRRGSGWPVLSVAVLSVAKLAWELNHDAALLTQTSWPAYPPAHAAGMLGGCLLLVSWQIFAGPVAGALGSVADRDRRDLLAVDGQ